MTRIFKSLKSIQFVILLLFVFFTADMLLGWWGPVESSSYFSKNDYEKTVLSHDGATAYDKVFFGNSVLISSYMETESTADYINFGLDYGTVRDLAAMLEGGYLTIGSDLVILLNYFVLLDTMDTNPSYPWLRRHLEPYCYFQRDRMQTLVTNAFNVLFSRFDNRLQGSLPRYTDLSKSVYYGILTDEELDAKIASQSETYWGLGPEFYQENLEALRQVMDYCNSRQVRLRVVLAPWNPYIPMPENPRAAILAADRLLADAGVEVLDLTNSYPRQFFYDLGHFNYEYGAVYFTEDIDQWLKS
jgi:hypothetical protein